MKFDATGPAGVFAFEAAAEFPFGKRLQRPCKLVVSCSKTTSLQLVFIQFILGFRLVDFELTAPMV